MFFSSQRIMFGLMVFQNDFQMINRGYILEKNYMDVYPCAANIYHIYALTGIILNIYTYVYD